jgi:hypothetical protein
VAVAGLPSVGLGTGTVASRGFVAGLQRRRLTRTIRWAVNEVTVVVIEFADIAATAPVSCAGVVC